MQYWNRISLTVLIAQYAFSIPSSKLLPENIEVDKTFFKKKAEIIKRQGESSALRYFFNLKRCCSVSPDDCDPLYAYRSIDGTCNNLENPCWGSTGLPFKRLLTPQYEDDFDSPRGFGRNPPLPRSRAVSVAMAETIVPPHPDGITLMVMQWGQFIDHDMVLTPNDPGTDACCSDFRTPSPNNPNCIAIDVSGDSFYRKFNVNCLPLFRSTEFSCFDGVFCYNPCYGTLDNVDNAAKKRSFTGGLCYNSPYDTLDNVDNAAKKRSFTDIGSKRQQINNVTSYLDGSQVYGSSIEEMTELRQSGSYYLNAGPGNEGVRQSCFLTPFSSTKEEDETLNNSPTSNETRKKRSAEEAESIKTGREACPLTFLPVRNTSGSVHFFAGDGRVEEQPGLTSLHTLFVRMHNSIGRSIKAKNILYSDEKVFQETRKLVIALEQHITLNEFLPILLGDSIMTTYNLKPKPACSEDPYSYDYDPNIDATAQNVLAAAAYRFGHSLIKDKYTLPNNITVNLSDSFNNHTRTTFPGTYPSHFLRGICTDSAEEMDHILVETVRNKLYTTYPFQNGSDLFARNVERGRDHGLPCYQDWANLCRGSVTEFDDLYQLMPKEVVDKFKLLYGGRLRDVDLYPAAIAENNLQGALLGPTFACLITKHFSRLKFGDRFWFENPGIFTADQLKSVQETKLSSMICKYTDATLLQEYVMLPVSPSNPLRTCSSLMKDGVINDVPLFW